MSLSEICLIVLAGIIVCLCNLGISKKLDIGGVFTLDTTNIFNGVAILFIMIGHVGQVLPFTKPFTPLGAVGGCLFLICSGYGIEKNQIKTVTKVIGRKG